jgi:phosphoethanolamine N-methyltransferase
MADYNILKCPADAGGLRLERAAELVCESCGRRYAIQEGIVRLLRAKEDPQSDVEQTNFLGKTDNTGHLGAHGATEALLSGLDMQGGTLLELGCGTGGTTLRLAGHEQINIIAADAQFAFLQRAAQRLEAAGMRERVLLVEADAHAFPFLDAQFDAVLIESVLVFCRAAEVIAGVFASLKPGGCIAVNEVTILNQSGLSLSRVISEKFNLAHLTVCDEGEWKTLFQEAGFEDIQCQVHPVNFFSLLMNPFTRGILNSLPLDSLDSIGYGLYTARKPNSYSNLT